MNMYLTVNKKKNLYLYIFHVDEHEQQDHFCKYLMFILWFNYDYTDYHLMMKNHITQIVWNVMWLEAGLEMLLIVKLK